MAVFEEKVENPINKRKLNNDNGLLVKEAISFAQRGKTIAACEAGCLGYVIQRAMEKAKIPCYVLPASKVVKKCGDRIKTDKPDARLIGRELRSGSIRPISVPDEANEVTRDLSGLFK